MPGSRLLGGLLWRLGLRERVTGVAEQLTAELRKQVKGRHAKTVSVLRTLKERHGETVSVLRELKEREASLAKVVEALDKKQAMLDRTLGQLAEARRVDAKQGEAIAALDERLQLEELEGAVRSAVDLATVDSDPFPHVVVTDVFPTSFYDLLLEAIPAERFWVPGRAGRQNWSVGENVAPLRSEMVWDFVNRIAERVFVPALLEKFEADVKSFYRHAFGPGAADALNHAGYEVSDKRLMLRRAGYHIAPHVDPFRAMLTVLVYLARPGDAEAYGTTLCRVEHEFRIGHEGIFYPEAEGISCDSVRRVPYSAELDARVSEPSQRASRRHPRQRRSHDCTLRVSVLYRARRQEPFRVAARSSQSAGTHPVISIRSTGCPMRRTDRVLPKYAARRVPWRRKPPPRVLLYGGGRREAAIRRVRSAAITTGVSKYWEQPSKDTAASAGVSFASNAAMVAAMRLFPD